MRGRPRFFFGVLLVAAGSGSSLSLSPDGSGFGLGGRPLGRLILGSAGASSSDFLFGGRPLRFLLASEEVPASPDASPPDGAVSVDARVFLFLLPLGRPRPRFFGGSASASAAGSGSGSPVSSSSSTFSSVGSSCGGDADMERALTGDGTIGEDEGKERRARSVQCPRFNEYFPY